MGVPVPLGVEESLMTRFPNRLDDWPKRRPKDPLEMFGIHERDAPPVHPNGDRDFFLRVGAGECDMGEVRGQRLAGLEDFLRPLSQIFQQPKIPSQLIGEDVHRRLQDSGDGRNGSALPSKTVPLCSKVIEIG